MADNSGGGGTSILAFLVGGLLVVVIGFFVLTGGHFGNPASTTHTVNLNVKAPGH
ncbi:MAG TPA: hypothetical protein VGG10_10390 [Rhizomicrobium sp.]|jgi:hypothetical protein